MSKIKTVLITGAGGFIGKAAVEALLHRGFHVIAMIRSGSLSSFTPHSNLSLLYADITIYESFKNKVKHVDAIVHLAANKYHPKLSYKVNLAGAKNIVRLIDEHKIRGIRVINVSSQSTKIRWKGVYGNSKLLSDHLIEVSNAEWTTIKPSLVYGREKGTLFQTIKGYVDSLPFVPLIGDGKWELYPVSVDDFVKAIIALLEKPKTIGKVYDFGCKKKVSFDELIQLIQQELHTSKPILHIPSLFGLIAVFVATKLIPNLPISVDNVLGSTQDTHCEPERAIKELGIEPMSVEKGVHAYLSNNQETKLPVAVVGLGKMGILHSTILNTLDEVRIIALVDREKSLGTTAQSMGIQAKFYFNLREAIHNETIQAVFICTPTFAHKEVIEICNEHNIPYFVEKPVFNMYEDFQTLMKSPKYMLDRNVAGYFWIYRREIEYVKKLLQKKEIGTLKTYHVWLKHSEVFGPKKGWLFQKKLSGGGVLANPGPHAFSLIQHFFGDASITSSHITSLYGNEVEDEARVEFLHKSGCQGTLDATWSVKGYPTLTIEFEIIGTAGSITWKNNALVMRKGGKITRLMGYQIPQQKPVYNLNPKSGGDAYYSEDLAFIQSLLKKDQKLLNTMIFAYKVESLIHEAYTYAQ